MQADTPLPHPHTSLSSSPSVPTLLPHAPLQPTQQQTTEQQHKTEQVEQQTQVEQQADAIDKNNVDSSQVQSPPPPNQEEKELNQPQEEQQLPNDTVSQPDLDLSDTQDPPSEFAYVDLYAIRKEVQCPICLGIIKKTRTVMECLHRFCRECIDKSMRMGNNECPACRTHCASRRSLRDDPRYDELIAALYPDVKKFEEEELAFYEEDESRNKQIQESITQVIVKQTEALGKKRSGSKDIAGTSVARSQRNYRSTPRRRRGRRRNGSTEFQDSDDNNEANDGDQLISPDDQNCEIYLRKRKRRTSIASSQSPSAPTSRAGSPEFYVEQKKEDRGLSPGLTCSAEMLAWGKGGVRSNIRHGNVNDDMSRSARSTRLAKLVDFLRDLENDDEYMALQMPLKDENGQIATKGPNGSSDYQSTPPPSSFNSDKLSQVTEPLPDMLHREENISGALSNGVENGERLIMAYQQKEAVKSN